MSAPCPVNSNTSISFPLYLGDDLSTGSPTNTGVGCGFITWSLARQPHLLARALDHKPAAVMLSFGDARPFVAAIKDAGAALISQVQTVAQAMEAVHMGSDIVVAQGTEAGGHGATRSTLALVPAV